MPDFVLLFLFLPSENIWLVVCEPPEAGFDTGAVPKESKSVAA
ncbi:MAG: hypothetical protein WAM26_18470 [Nitrososphaeraceae archaeon]